MPELDRKATSVFAGKVVRKDLVRKVKVGANVPVFVLEYLLGKYCASDDPVAIGAGLRVVNSTIAANFVRPDEANKVQSLVKDKGKHTLIDKVKVRYLSDDDKHWAELVNFGHKFVHVPEHFLREYERLLMGGIWAQIDIRHQYDEAKGKRSPFWIDGLKPIQIATFDLAEYCQCRREFSTDEWLDLLLRTIGLEPAHFNRRLKMLFLVRMIPLCERNYNLVELGPRGTGKSYAYQELSPYTILLTGPTTVPNLFYNMATGKMGLVGIWDAIAFDEVADLQKMQKEVITTLKTYCESGMFARGKDALTGTASIALFGNTNQAVDVMVRSSHLFMPMPDVIREDRAAFSIVRMRRRSSNLPSAWQPSQVLSSRDTLKPHSSVSQPQRTMREGLSSGPMDASRWGQVCMRILPVRRRSRRTCSHRRAGRHIPDACTSPTARRRTAPAWARPRCPGSASWGSRCRCRMCQARSTRWGRWRRVRTSSAHNCTTGG